MDDKLMQAIETIICAAMMQRSGARAGTFMILTADTKYLGVTCLNIARAVLAAKEYCKEKGYNEKAIDVLYKQVISGKMYVAKFPDVSADGLKNDLDTRPIPVLAVDADYSVTEFAGGWEFLKSERY